MALSEKQVSEIKEHLDNCKNPLFFFDDDQDGLCSFLQFYRYKKEGHGVIVKTVPKLNALFLRKVEEYHPDKIFVLDLAVIEQEFLDEAKVPVVWVDHHGPFERHKVSYYNPRVSNSEHNHPTSYLCYQVVQQDMWLAAIGCIADWVMPPFLEEFRKEFPGLIEDKYKTPGDIIYNTKLGEIIRVFSFILKGKHSEIMKIIKILSRIKSPYEILDSQSSQGRLLYKKYEEVNKSFQPLLTEVLDAARGEKEKLVVYTYNGDQTSFTSDLSNEAIYRHPGKIILVGREKNDEMKCSLRSSEINLKPLVERALLGLNGYGGGHENACGLNIKKDDFEEFVERLKGML